MRNTTIGRTRIEAVLNRIRRFLQADGADIETRGRTDGLCQRSPDRPGSVQNRALSMHMGLSEVLREEIPDFAELRLV